MVNRIGKLVSPYKLLLPLCFGVFIAADDMTVVVTLLPDMMTDLRVGVGDLDRASWTITGYLIGFTAAMPLMGRVSDRAGYRRAFLIAIGVFTLGSCLVALSPQIPGWLYGGLPELGWMIAMRIIQAAGGGALIPIAIAAAGELVDSKHRAISYGLIGASVEAGGVFGPLWGGGIAHWLSWEWAFWLNIPLTVLASLWIMRNPAGNRHSIRIDFHSAAVFAIILTLLTIGLTRVGESDMLMVLSLALSAGLTVLLVKMNNSSRDPLFPPGLFTLPTFNYANATHLLVGAILIISMVTVPLMAATVFGKTPLEGGLQLLRMTVAIGIGAVGGGFATQHLGPRVPVLSGLLVTGVGCFLVSEWTVYTSDPAITIHLVIMGLGLGFLVAPITEVGLTRVTTSQRGVASALVTVSRMVGMTAGLAAMTALGTTQFHHLVADLPAFSLDPEIQKQIAESASTAGMTVFNRFLQYAAGISVLALAPAWLMTTRSSLTR